MLKMNIIGIDLMKSIIQICHICGQCRQMQLRLLDTYNINAIHYHF